MSNNILCLDIGGTNPRMIMVKVNDNNSFELIGKPYMVDNNSNSIIPHINDYLKVMGEKGFETDTCVISVAGEIINNKTNTLANANFSIDGNEIKNETLLSNVLLINDFKAIGEGISTYDTDSEVIKVDINKASQNAKHILDEIKNGSISKKIIQVPNYDKDKNEFFFAESIKGQDKGVIGPGTGLGIAYLININDDINPNYFTKASEGGHSGMSIRPEFSHMYDFLLSRLKVDQLGMESFVSGNGIINIIEYLLIFPHGLEHMMVEDFENKVSDEEVAKKVNEFMSNEETKKEIPRFVSENRHNNRLCNLAMEIFIKFLGFSASDIALQGLTLGGLFLAGGVLPKNIELLFDGTFSRSFADNWKKEELLSKVPIYLVVDYDVSFYGCAKASLEKFNI